ncbi:MAG: hypothetical protein K8I27_04105 [Planctomycetes bacterium]|nr:hypothetical protein [Planctomycetota bacterium]
MTEDSNPYGPRPEYPGNQGPRPAQYPGPNQAPPNYQSYGYQQPYAPLKPFSNKAIVSIVCGGVSVLFWPVAPITGLVGAIIGFMGMKDSKEPGATHRGWGLALAGVIVSAGMFVIGLGLVALFVWVFAFAKDQADRMDRDRTVRMQEYAYEEDAREDMDLISRRIQTYCVDNGGSLAPGGPLVRDYPDGGLIPEDHLKVEEPLQIKHLVYDDELLNPAGDYELKISSDEKGFTLTNGKGGLRLTIKDARYINSSIETTAKLK